MTCWASQAADNHAAQEDAAEARAAFVERFAQDAADELLAEDGNAQYLLGKTDALEALLLAVLDADPQNAYTRIVAMRDGLRAEMYRCYEDEVEDRAEKLAREFERDDEPDFDRLNTLPLAAVCPVPMFPQVRRIPGERAVWPAGLTHLQETK